MKKILIFLGILGIIGTCYAYLQKKNDLDRFWAIGQLIATENRTDTLMIDDTISEYAPINLPYQWKKGGSTWLIKAEQQQILLQKNLNQIWQTSVMFSLSDQKEKGISFEDWDKDGTNDLIFNYEDGTYRVLRYDKATKIYYDLGDFGEIHHLTYSVFYETRRPISAGLFCSTLLQLRNNNIKKIAYIQGSPHPENQHRVATIDIFLGVGEGATLVQSVAEERVLGYYVDRGLMFDYDEFAKRFWKTNWQTFIKGQ